MQNINCLGFFCVLQILWSVGLANYYSLYSWHMEYKENIYQCMFKYIYMFVCWHFPISVSHSKNLQKVVHV
jgi:hypothetical protein